MSKTPLVGNSRRLPHINKVRRWSIRLSVCLHVTSSTLESDDSSHLMEMSRWQGNPRAYYFRSRSRTPDHARLKL